MQQDDGVSLAYFHVGHLAIQDTPPLFWVWKYCRNFAGWCFVEESHALIDAPGLPKALPAISRRLRCFAVKEMHWLLVGQRPEHGRRKEDDNPTPTAFRLDFGHEFRKVRVVLPL